MFVRVPCFSLARSSSSHPSSCFFYPVGLLQCPTLPSLCPFVESRELIEITDDSSLLHEVYMRFMVVIHAGTPRNTPPLLAHQCKVSTLVSSQFHPHAFSIFLHIFNALVHESLLRPALQTVEQHGDVGGLPDRAAALRRER